MLPTKVWKINKSSLGNKLILEIIVQALVIFVRAPTNVSIVIISDYFLVNFFI